jgi:hypothetical protein
VAGPPTPNSLLDEQFLRRLERLTFVARHYATGGVGGEHRSRARASSIDFADYRPCTQRHRVSGTPGQPGRVAARRAQPRRTMDVLRFLDQATSGQGRLDFGVALGDFQADRPYGHRRGSQVVLLSDLLPPAGLEPGLDGLLRAQLDVVVVQVLCPQELEPAPGGDFEFIDAETGTRVHIGLSLAAVTQYQQRLAAALHHIEDVCLRRRVRYLLVRTDEPLEDVILSALRKGMILA